MEENVPPSSPPPIAPPPPVVPPVPPPPPVITPPPRQPGPKGGRGWMVLALILLGLLFLSVFYNIGSFFAGTVLHGRPTRYTHVAGPRLDEVVREDQGSANKIAIIEVDGIITSRVIDKGGYNMVDVLKAQLKQAEEDDRVKAVILRVDSPGGEVLASDEISRALADFQEKTRKPVIGSMGGLAASGGYYISAPCRWIVANDLTITGSIGVIMSSWNYRGLMDKVGLRPETYKSGKYKDMLSGSRSPDQVTSEERAMIQALIDETFNKFKSVVQEGRDRAHDLNKDGKVKGRPLRDDWEQFADGRVLSGTEAYKLGFVDELGDFDQAVSRAKDLAGNIKHANLIEYQQRYDLSDFFRLFGRSEARSIKVDLGMEIPKLQAGQLYFLSPTFVQ